MIQLSPKHGFLGNYHFCCTYDKSIAAHGTWRSTSKTYHPQFPEPDVYKHWAASIYPFFGGLHMEYEIHSSVPRTFGVYIAFPISLAFSSTARSDTNSGNSVLWWIFKWIDRTRLGMLDGWCFDGMCMHGQEDITKGCMSEFPLIQCCIQPAWAASCWVRMDGQIDGWLMQRGRMLMLGHRAHTYELHWPFCFLHCGVFCGCMFVPLFQFSDEYIFNKTILPYITRS